MSAEQTLADREAVLPPPWLVSATNRLNSDGRFFVDTPEHRIMVFKYEDEPDHTYVAAIRANAPKVHHWRNGSWGVVFGFALNSEDPAEPFSVSISDTAGGHPRFEEKRLEWLRVIKSALGQPAER